MGIEVKRFVDNVNSHLICGLCKDVLQNPLMIKECEHFFCVKCIQNQMKTSAVCPIDKNMLSYSQLVEPQNLILKLLNELKLKCEFSTDGCDVVITLGEMDKHRRVCAKNPMNNTLIKCFCGQELVKKDLHQHKQNCLLSVKNEIHINRSQIATLMADIYNDCNSKTSGKRFRSEAEYLYHKLSQSLPQRARNQNSIENILLFLNWRIFEYNPKTAIEETNRIRSGLRDLFCATYNNSEAIREFCRLNGLDYIILIRNLVKNRDIDLSITDTLTNFCRFDAYLKKLMDRPIMDMLLNLLRQNLFGIENSFNCVEILSQMILSFNHIWIELSSHNERTLILNRLKATINGWKLNARLRKYSSLDSQIKRLRKHLNEMPTEVLYKYVWILVHHTRADPQKYVQMVEDQNVKQLLQPILDDDKYESYIKNMIRLLFYQMSTFKTTGHLNGLENSDKREVLIN